MGKSTLVLRYKMCARVKIIEVVSEEQDALYCNGLTTVIKVEGKGRTQKWLDYVLSGTRFRPLSLQLPKPLFPIAGVPLVEHHIDQLSQVVRNER